MDFELRRAREKIEKEQKERKEKARLRVLKEKKAKEDARIQREAIEAAQRSRRIDAAEAQLKADQEMQENLLAGRGIVFYRLLEAVPYQGIQFTDEEKTGTTHSGVLEFTADEGSVGLPPHVWNNLFCEGSIMESPLVEVRYVWLPKGTYAKLQPERVGFSDLPNHKAILETSLRQHATLSQGDIFIVNYGELEYKLKVLELKPSSSVSVLETDIEVDIVDPIEFSEQTHQHVLIPVVFRTSQTGTVEEGKFVYYKFSIDNDTWEKISSGSSSIEVKLESETNEGDTDLFISRHPLIFPTRHQHEWSSHDIGSKTLILSSKDKNLAAGTYSIGVYGFKGSTEYKLSVTIQDNLNQKLGQQASSSMSSMELDTEQCRNCRHYIPSRTIALHEAYCTRHNVTCQHEGCGVVLRIEESKNHIHCNRCGQAFQQAELEKHMKVFHEPLKCPCGIILEKEQMVEHQASVCPLRLISCRFCGDMVQAGSSAMDVRDRLRGLSEHESVCGSRTAPCDSCGRSVMLKEMDIHQIAVHQKG
ncbi:unnamed protein product [Vicia faba]|uniref:Uncharacterized protein n=1 Tax=Vicia faba TaxID=3906 RepID=A0AAV0YL53_VICFA|nr:unnamed protein product [Vicia faba]